MQLRCVSSIALDVEPAEFGHFHVEPGEEFLVADRVLARSLLEQADNYAPDDDESRDLLAEIVAEAAHVEEAGAAVVAAEDMTVAELLPLLDAMTVEQLMSTQAAESAGKDRKTVLERITALLDGGPAATNVEG